MSTERPTQKTDIKKIFKKKELQTGTVRETIKETNMRTKHKEIETGTERQAQKERH